MKVGRVNSDALGMWAWVSAMGMCTWKCGLGQAGMGMGMGKKACAIASFSNHLQCLKAPFHINQQ